MSRLYKRYHAGQPLHLFSIPLWQLKHAEIYARGARDSPFTPLEERPMPQNVYNWRLYATAMVASFAALAVGYDSTFIAQSLALPSLTSELGFDHMTASHRASVSENISTAYQAGAMFGSFAAYPVAHCLGHKLSLVWFSLFLILGSSLTLGADYNRGLDFIYAGRTLTGMGVGACCMVTPIYLSEISPPAIRGRICGMFGLFWQFGGVAGFWINYAVFQTLDSSRKQWLIPFGLQLLPAGLLFFGALFWLKESPRWLLSNKSERRDDAIANLKWMRRLPADDTYFVEEVAMIEYAIIREHTSETFWQPFKAVLTHKPLQRRLLLVALMMMLHSATGATAVSYYSPTLFKSIAITGTENSLLSTGVLSIMQASCALLWMLFLIDRLGRRNLLMLGAAGCSISLWIIGAQIFTQRTSPTNAEPNSHNAMNIAAVCFIYFHISFFSLSWSGTPWVLTSEIFSTSQTRALGQSHAAFQFWLWQFVFSRFLPQMFSQMGKNGYGVFFFFASVMLVGVGIVWLGLPETRAVLLEDMDRLFEIKPARKANRKMMQHVEDMALGQGRLEMEMEIDTSSIGKAF
ncbi:hypothetical protein BST61_g10529 [Cercospora zeina]